VYASIAAHMRSIPATNTNGSQPAQLVKLNVHLEELKRSEAVRAAAAPEIKRFLEQLNYTQADILKRLQSSEQTHEPANLWPQLAWRVGIAAAIFAFGYLVCWVNLHKDADARLDRLINAQAFPNRAQLFLGSHGGSIAREPITPAHGHSEKEGIVVRRGDLAQPWISTDGNAVIPIPQ
jgi:hypothetical protein